MLILKRYFDACRALIRHSILRADSSAPGRIVLALHSNVRLRTVRQLLILFQLSGYEVLVKGQLNRKTLTLARSLQWHQNTSLLWSSIPKATLVCSDNPALIHEDDSRNNPVIHLHYDLNPELLIKHGHVALPFTMHPQIYGQYRAHENLDQYRQSSRRIRILFAGNLEKQGYDNELIGNLFDKKTRFQVIDFLRCHEKTLEVSDQEVLDQILSGRYTNRFVLIDTQRLRINQEEWLSLIAQADFFLAPPGVMMPMCHNAIEAMAVGTIPITNYPDWFYPNLRHLHNCIAFSSLAELNDIWELALTMDTETIRQLRAEVTSYYETRLNPSTVLKPNLEHSSLPLHLHILEPYFLTRSLSHQKANTQT